MSNRAGGNSRADQYDHLIKLLLIGDLGVGKSSLLLRYSDDSFTSSFITTIGTDFKIKTIMCGKAKVKLQIWDTVEPGQERFRKAHYRGAKGILLVYDVSDETSFVNVRNWMKQIDQNATENVNRILIGNKCDVDASERKIPSEKGKALADEYGIKFFETSAKLYVNVDECFMAIAKDIVEHLKENPDGSSGILEMPPRRDRKGRTPFYPKTCLALAAVGYFASYWIWDWIKSTDLLLGLTFTITYLWLGYFALYGFFFPIIYD